MTLEEHVARAIFAAAFEPRNANEAELRTPSPGWCWEKASPEQKAFAKKQARAAIAAMRASQGLT